MLSARVGDAVEVPPGVVACVSDRLSSCGCSGAVLPIRGTIETRWWMGVITESCLTSYSVKPTRERSVPGKHVQHTADQTQAAELRPLGGGGV